jgi:hypothetical protein
VSQLSRQCGILNILQPYRPPRPVTGIALLTVRGTVRGNIKISARESQGYYVLKRHKLWFDKGCPKLLDQGKQAKLQWLQGPSEINEDNLNNVRHEASRHFRNKKRDYMKDKIDELAADRTRTVQTCLEE